MLIQSLTKTYSVVVFCLMVSYLGYGQDQKFFTENKGQWKPDVEYASRTKAGDLFIFDNKVAYKFYGDLLETGTITKPVYTSCAFSFLNPSQYTSLDRTGRLNFTTDYHRKSGNIKQVESFKSILYNNLYDGVNMKISHEGDGVSYELILEPYADLKKIKVFCEGFDSVRVNSKGDLQFYNELGKILKKKPIAFQISNNQRVEVRCDYTVNGDTVEFYVPDGYEKSLNLHIKPEVFLEQKGLNTGVRLASASCKSFDEGGIASFSELALDYDGLLTYYSPYDKLEPLYSKGILDRNAILEFYNQSGNELKKRIVIEGNNADHIQDLELEGELIYGLGTTLSDNLACSENAHQSENAGGSDHFIFAINNEYVLAYLSYFGAEGNEGINTSSYKYLPTKSEHLNAFNLTGYSQFIGDISILGNSILLAGATNSANWNKTDIEVYGNKEGKYDGLLAEFELESLKPNKILIVGGEEDDIFNSITFNEKHIYLLGNTISSKINGLEGESAGLSDALVAVIDKNDWAAIEGKIFGSNNLDKAFHIGCNEQSGYILIENIDGLKNTETQVKHGLNLIQFDLENYSITKSISLSAYTSQSLRLQPTAFKVNDLNILLGGFERVNLTGNNNNSGELDYFRMQVDASLDSILSFFNAGRANTNEQMAFGYSFIDEGGKIYQSVQQHHLSLLPTPTPSIPEGGGNSISVSERFFIWDNPYSRLSFNLEKSICTGEKLNLKNSSINYTDFIWRSNKGHISSQLDPDFKFNDTGDVVLSLKARSKVTGNFHETSEKLLVHETPSSSFTYQVLKGQRVHFRASETGHQTYIWQLNNSESFEGPNFVKRLNSPAYYNVSLSVVSGQGCSSINDTEIDLTALNSESFQGEEVRIQVYPNPFVDYIQLEINSAYPNQVEITMVDMQGKQSASIFNKKVEAGEQHIKIPTPTYFNSAGIYLLEVKYGDNYQLFKLNKRLE